MSRLILIRHARPNVEPDVPSSRWRLSDEGRDACKPLAARLKALGPTWVFASVEPKAWETGAIVAQRLEVPCSAVPGLHEHEREGAPYLERARFEATMADLFARPGELVYGRETAAQARERFAAAVDGVLAERPEQTLAIASHGTVISLFVADRAGVDGHALWQRLGQPDAVVLELPTFALVES